MEAIKKELHHIECKIEWEKESLDKAVANFKECSAKYDANHIIVFIPGMVEEIRKHQDKLDNLAEQKAMLEYLLKQQEV